jgi:hypothetical protein
MAIENQGGASEVLVGNLTEYVFFSTNSDEPNFSFIVEVYLNDGLHSTHEVYPEVYQNTGRFSIKGIARSVVTSNVPSEDDLIANFTAENKWKLIVYEKYGTPPVIDPNSDFEFGEQKLLNGCLRVSEFYKVYNYADTPVVGWPAQLYNINEIGDEAQPPVKLFLTDFPRNQKEFVRYNEAKYLSILNQYDTIDGSTDSTVEIELYDISNTLITSASFSVVGFQFPMLSVGPAKLVESTSLISTDFNNCYYYTVRIWNDDDSIIDRPLNTSEEYRLYYDQECERYPNKRLTWLNKYGAWDSFTFKLLSEENTKIDINRYSKSMGEWTAASNPEPIRGQRTYNLSQGEQMVLSKRSIDNLILNSDWINEDVQQWLVRELYESPRVYLHVDDVIEMIEPVIITNAETVLKQRKKFGLIQEQVVIERSYSRLSQIG